DETGRHPMSNAVGPQLESESNAGRVALDVAVELEGAPQHLLTAAVKEAMIAERPRITFDTALAGSNVGHPAGGLHVTVLTVTAPRGRGTVEAFAVGAVNMDAEHPALVAGGAVTAVLVEGRISIFSAIHGVKRAEEELSLRRPQERQDVPH